MYAWRQPQLLAELKERIQNGVYAKKLPTGMELAAEFNVNVKTIHKVLNQLAAGGWVERHRRTGTLIVPKDDSSVPRLIEVIFSGFTSPFQHPFWSELFLGIHEELLRRNCRMLLNHINSDPQTHLFKISQIQLSEAAGRIVTGPGELWLLRWIAGQPPPMISAGDEIGDEKIPQVYFDFTHAIFGAVRYLCKERECRNIGFIGHVTSLQNPSSLQKFHAYLSAMQKFRQMNPDLVEGCWPWSGEGVLALERMLKRIRPDALVVAFGSQVPEIIALLKKQRLEIPVIDCDGLPIHEPYEDYHPIRVPLRQCGTIAAGLLLDAIDACRNKIQRCPLRAVFGEGEAPGNGVSS